MSRPAHARELEEAWRWREERGFFAGTEALRIFHGPGEGSAGFRNLAVDRFGEHYWVTEWQETGAPGPSPERREELARFLAGKGAKSAVALWRPEKGTPDDPTALLGSPPAAPFEVAEGRSRYLIRLLGTKHPGLFLDHAPLRAWLQKRARGWKVLNTFAYTGSLSVAAGLGHAAHVTTLDLSKPSLRWAEENWCLNGLAPDEAKFIAGDVFEWLPRLRRKGAAFDCVILDPPSFSHGEKGRFSTAKDLEKLHALAFDVLAPGGTLVTSINSANVAAAKFDADVAAAARSRGRDLEILWRIDLPETFPTRRGSPLDRYLKGFVARDMSSGKGAS